MPTVENVTPILRIDVLDVSRRYYSEKLGFDLDWETDGMISVSRDQKSIMLIERQQGQPGTWIWIGVDDADALYAELTARGAHVRHPHRTLPGPTSSRSRTLTAMCFASGPSR